MVDRADYDYDYEYDSKFLFLFIFENFYFLNVVAKLYLTFMRKGMINGCSLNCVKIHSLMLLYIDKPIITLPTIEMNINDTEEKNDDDTALESSIGASVLPLSAISGKI